MMTERRTTIRARILLGIFFGVLCSACCISAGAQPPQNLDPPQKFEPPLYLEPTSQPRAEELRTRKWIDTIAREVPPLKNACDRRMPMIMWHEVGFAPLTPNEISVLKQRGLCQHLQLSESMIGAAKVLSEAGMPVILMEGRTDHWPYSLAEDPNHWSHQFDISFQPPWFGKEDSDQWHGACPHQIDGWKVLAKQTRRTMEKFRDAGVRVDAVLVDYEGDPYPWSHLFSQLQHCKRCRQELPPEIIVNKTAWRNDAWQRYVSLYDEYFAKPIREVFPDCLVTNWHVVFSSESDPVRYFVRNVDLPALRPKHFSATNPIAYASDAVWASLWDPSTEPSRQSVDDFYARQLKHQVAADRRNREAAGAAHVRAIPWVARVCKLGGGDEASVPIMSRERYRQSLGELWQMGIETMQIFNPMHQGYEELSIMEVQDAVAAYDRMLADGK